MNYISMIPYPNAEIMTKWDVLLTKSLDEVMLLEKSWREIEAQNQAINIKNRDLRTAAIHDIENVLNRYGIPTHNDSKKKSYTKRFSSLIDEYLSIWKLPQVPSFPMCSSMKQTVQNIELSQCNYLELVPLYKDLSYKFKQQLQYMKRQEEQYRLYLRYLEEHQIKLSQFTNLDPSIIRSFVETQIYEKYPLFIESMRYDEPEDHEEEYIDWSIEDFWEWKQK